MKTQQRDSFVGDIGARLSRRSLLAAVAASTSLFIPRRSIAATEIGEAKTINHQPSNYHGWPTLTRRRNGELLLVCSGSRESHVCPFGRVELMRSKDNGKTWSFPRVLMDSPIDDRDAGVVETAKGSLLVTTFTSLAYVPQVPKRKGWRAAHERIGEAERKKELGQWMIRSTDGGVTWSPRYSSIVNSPHGPIQLSDGRLLYAGKELWTGQRRIGVCESTDDGVTWKWLAQVPTRDGDNPANYHELHAVEAADGRLIAHIRNHNAKNNREELQTESSDGGKTWSKPHAIGVWGLPSFLLRLKDDRLLMTYGHRRKPLGCQARVSEDHGRTWSDPIIVYGGGASGDLGYPSTVQFDDGSLLTVWYELTKGTSRASLRQARWKLA